MIVSLLIVATVLAVCGGLCWWNIRKGSGAKPVDRVDLTAMVSDAVFLWLIISVLAGMVSNAGSPLWVVVVQAAGILTVAHAAWLSVQRWPAATAQVAGVSITSLAVSLLLVAAAVAARCAPLVLS